MSKLFSPVKSSIGLTGQQCGNFQYGLSGSSTGTSESSSGASSLNAQQASVGLANKINGSNPAAVARGGAIVDLNRSIQTPKPYYPKEDGDFITWSNMTVHSEVDASKSKDN